MRTIDIEDALKAFEGNEEAIEKLKKIPLVEDFDGHYKCFNCGCNSVSWDNDFTYEDYGIFDRDGIVHALHCNHCGAYVEYYVDCGDEEGNEDEQGI